MGLFEVIQTTLIGLMVVIISGAAITTMWPTLNVYFGNSETFLLAALILLIIGFIPLAIVIALIKKIFNEVETNNNFNDRGNFQ